MVVVILPTIDAIFAKQEIYFSRKGKIACYEPQKATFIKSYHTG
ncbi:hypothetical protein SAMN05660293_03838 [Dyadobacter psychrophilus]|uniref:Uncharacterized protein n=1 Tax=Dyadobacter psychrophilus TaxID=651661 RepID=A0A1T5G9T2_9BACT|nr:hypothetical protein SAMN05660293_03838 [Dyadobacter psychrophilus]